MTDAPLSTEVAAMCERLLSHAKWAERYSTGGDVCSDAAALLARTAKERDELRRNYVDQLKRADQKHEWALEEARKAVASEAQVERLTAALTLAEDVLSRRPYSAELWPNGMHPQVGMELIRAALQQERKT